MYNQKVLSYLTQISEGDLIPEALLKESHHTGDHAQSIYLYYDQTSGMSYIRGLGSPYLLAMLKWLQIELNQGNKNTLHEYHIQTLVALFDIPVHKKQDAFMILEIIEQILDAS